MAAEGRWENGVWRGTGWPNTPMPDDQQPRCIVCQAGPWRYGCPCCGWRPYDTPSTIACGQPCGKPRQGKGRPPITAYRDKLNAGHYAPPQQAQAEQPPADKPKPKPRKKTAGSG